MSASDDSVEAMKRLTAGVADELNHLLTPIAVEIERVAAHAEDAARVRQHVTALRLAVARAQELAERVAVIAGPSAGVRDWVELNRIVGIAVQSARDGIDPRIHISTTFDHNLPQIAITRADVVQIVTTLLFNARDALSAQFSAAAGAGSLPPRIDISTELVTLTQQAAPARSAVSRFQVIRIRDNGPGLSPDARARAFEPFFTTKPPGAGHGLGLALAQRLARNHEGWIELRSRPGEGCEAVVFIPELPQSGASAASEPAQISQDHRRLKVLLIEDNFLVSTALTGLLEEADYDVTHAESAERGWELLNQSGARFDVILTDFYLPGLTGKQLLGKIRETDVATPVLVMSGHIPEDEATALFALGASGLVPKPIDPTSLVNAIRGAMAWKRS